MCSVNLDVYGESRPKYNTVAKWSEKFKHGRDSCQDDPRSGSPVDIIRREIIDRVVRLVLNNRPINVTELAAQCGISSGNVYTIIQEHLGMSKVHTETRKCKIVSKNVKIKRDFHNHLVTGD